MRFVLLLLATFAATPALAQEGKSSLYALIDKVAESVEHRARVERAGGPARLEVSAARGIDGRRAEREFGARLRRRLREGDIIVPVPDAGLVVRVLLSQERGLVWATGSLEGGALIAPVPFAVSVAIDRELELALGASARRGRARWVVSRLGTIAGGVLDIVAVDVDGEPGDELVALGVDGLRFYRARNNDARPLQIAGPYALPDRPWPRVLGGWLGVDNGALRLRTTAGHAHTFDLKKRTYARPPQAGAPLQQPGGGVVIATTVGASPLLEKPIVIGGKVVELGVPRRFRDLVRSPLHADTWLFVDDEGAVGALQRGRLKRLPVADGSGDRLLLADFDADAQVELVTSSSSAAGEPDQITVYRLDAALEQAVVVARAGLSGGAIVAFTVADLDLDGRDEILAVEDFGGEECVLWRLGYAP